MRRNIVWQCLIVTGFFALGAGTPGEGASAAKEAAAAYEEVLSAYVDGEGLVDYAKLKTHRRKIDEFVGYLARVDARAYAAWDESEKIAFWINAYNALTLRAVVDHYPIEPSKVKSLVYPKQSIRQIAGVWEVLKFTVMGKPLSLNDIEHEVLRGKFDEPRIHVALVCASIGCPPLLREAFRGPDLDGQLDGQARRFLAIERNFQIDRGRGVVHLSSIFDWFGEDFAGFGKRMGLKHGHEVKKRAALEFVLNYVDDADRRYIMEEKYDVAYLPYDWALNVQPPETGER
ncbi:MAG: DUF547 domain-containing protein [Candidatus Krumholzibacteriia bacterium]